MMTDTRDATRGRRKKAWLSGGVLTVIFSFLSVPPAAASWGCQETKGHHAMHGPNGGEVRGEQQSLGPLSIPDVEVLDQNGKPMRFYRDLVEGKVVAINFLFTTCTTICPPLGANFSKLQKLLQDSPANSADDVRLISVSVDPVVDTPERLKAWAAIFHARPGWTLVTGEKREIDTLLKALKVFTPDKQDHSPIVLLGSDPKGIWTRAYGLTPPAKLASLVERLLAESDVPGESHPEVRR